MEITNLDKKNMTIEIDGETYKVEDGVLGIKLVGATVEVRTAYSSSPISAILTISEEVNENEENYYSINWYRRKQNSIISSVRVIRIK